MASINREALAGDAMVLRGWAASDEYQTWLKYVDLAYEDWTTKLVNAIGDPRSDYYRGIVAGLKIAAQIPENVTLLAKNAKTT